MVVLLGMFFLTVSMVYGQCTPEDIENELKYGASAEKQGMYDAAAANYKTAASCSEYIKEYDNAIEYRLKAVEMLKKINWSTSSAYILIAEHYTKKGPGFEDEIRKYCDLAEEDSLNQIEKQLKRDKPNYSIIMAEYSGLASCYKLVNDTVKSCDYCLKDNEYSKKIGPEVRLSNCEYYGCPKASGVSPEAPLSSGGGLSFVLLVAGFLSVLIFAVVFLLLRKKK